MTDSPSLPPPQPYTGDWVPRPDPTRLTTEAQREIEERWNDRLDRAISALNDKSEYRYELLKVEMAGMKDLSIATKEASERSISAALESAREVVASQYRNFANQLDKTGESIGQRITGSEAQISDMKDRLIRLEQSSVSTAQLRSEDRSVSSNTMMLIMVAFGFINILLVGGALLIHPLAQPQAAAQAQPSAATK